jgi:5-formyltetrahydrofolate cyclo-ligase
MLKRDIRKLYSQKRQVLSPEEFETHSERMMQEFNNLSWKDIQALLSYYSIPGRMEFNAAACEEVMLQKFPSLIVAHPKIDEDDTNMQAISIKGHPEYSMNRYNIAEPQNGEIINPGNIDLIFVPLLAFDPRGYRVGYGKGYYDRFISRCRPDALKVGFSFFDPVQSIEDINQFDVPLNLCITPMRVYEF